MRSQPHPPPLPHHRPIPNSYPVPGAALYAGEYPGTATAASSRAKLTARLDAGITAFIDESAIPREWRGRLARKPLLDGIAESLFQHAFNTAPISEPQVQRATMDAHSLIDAEDGDVFAALRRFREQEEAEIRASGVVAFSMGGSLHARSTRDYLVLLLRIEAGLRLVDGDVVV